MLKLLVFCLLFHSYSTQGQTLCLSTAVDCVNETTRATESFYLPLDSADCQHPHTDPESNHQVKETQASGKLCGYITQCNIFNGSHALCTVVHNETSNFDLRGCVCCAGTNCAFLLKTFLPEMQRLRKCKTFLKKGIVQNSRRRIRRATLQSKLSSLHDLIYTEGDTMTNTPTVQDMYLTTSSSSQHSSILQELEGFGESDYNTGNTGTSRQTDKPQIYTLETNSNNVEPSHNIAYMTSQRSLAVKSEPSLTDGVARPAQSLKALPFSLCYTVSVFFENEVPADGLEHLSTTAGNTVTKTPVSPDTYMSPTSILLYPNIAQESVGLGDTDMSLQMHTPKISSQSASIFSLSLDESTNIASSDKYLNFRVSDIEVLMPAQSSIVDDPITASLSVEIESSLLQITGESMLSFAVRESNHHSSMEANSDKLNSVSYIPSVRLVLDYYDSMAAVYSAYLDIPHLIPDTQFKDTSETFLLSDAYFTEQLESPQSLSSESNTLHSSMTSSLDEFIMPVTTSLTDEMQMLTSIRRLLHSPEVLDPKTLSLSMYNLCTNLASFVDLDTSVYSLHLDSPTPLLDVVTSSTSAHGKGMSSLSLLEDFLRAHPTQSIEYIEFPFGQNYFQIPSRSSSFFHMVMISTEKPFSLDHSFSDSTENELTMRGFYDLSPTEGDTVTNILATKHIYIISSSSSQESAGESDFSTDNTRTSWQTQTPHISIQSASVSDRSVEYSNNVEPSDNSEHVISQSQSPLPSLIQSVDTSLHPLHDHSSMVQPTKNLEDINFTPYSILSHSDVSEASTIALIDLVSTDMAFSFHYKVSSEFSQHEVPADGLKTYLSPVLLKSSLQTSFTAEETDSYTEVVLLSHTLPPVNSTVSENNELTMFNLTTSGASAAMDKTRPGKHSSPYFGEILNETNDQLLHTNLLLRESIEITSKDLVFSQDSSLFEYVVSDELTSVDTKYITKPTQAVSVASFSNTGYMDRQTNVMSLHLYLIPFSSRDYNVILSAEDEPLSPAYRSDTFDSNDIPLLSMFPSLGLEIPLEYDDHEFSTFTVSEHIISDINSLVMESKMHLSEEILPIDRSNTEELFSTATTHFMDMTRSIFDLASNVLNTVSVSLHPVLTSGFDGAPLSGENEVVVSHGLAINTKVSVPHPLDSTHSPTHTYDAEYRKSTLVIDLTKPSAMPVESTLKIEFVSSGYDLSNDQYEELSLQTTNLFYSGFINHLSLQSSFCSEVLNTGFKEPASILLTDIVTTPTTLPVFHQDSNEVTSLLSPKFSSKLSFHYELFRTVSVVESLLHNIPLVVSVHDSKHYLKSDSTYNSVLHSSETEDEMKAYTGSEAPQVFSMESMLGIQSLALNTPLLDSSSVRSDSVFSDISSQYVTNSVIPSNTLKLETMISDFSVFDARQDDLPPLSTNLHLNTLHFVNLGETYSKHGVAPSLIESVTYLTTEIFSTEALASQTMYNLYEKTDLFDQSISLLQSGVMTTSSCTQSNPKEPYSLLKTSLTHFKSFSWTPESVWFSAGDIIKPTAVVAFTEFPSTSLESSIESKTDTNMDLESNWLTSTGVDCTSCLTAELKSEYTNDVPLSVAASPTYTPLVRPEHSTKGLTQSTPSLVKDSFGFITDLQDGLSLKTFINSNLNTLQGIFLQETSFGNTTATEPATIFINNTPLPKFPPSVSSLVVMTVPAELITLSSAESEKLSYMTKTTKSLVVEGTTGRKGLSTFFQPVSSFSAFKQPTGSLKSSPAATLTSSCITQDYTFDLPIAETLAIDTVPGQSSIFQSELFVPSSFFPSLSYLPPINTTTELKGTLPLTFYNTFSTFSMFRLYSEPQAIPTASSIRSASTATPSLEKFVREANSSQTLSYISSKAAVLSVITQAALPHNPTPVTVSKPYVLSSLPGPFSASQPAPSVQKEHLLEITLRVNNSVKIFDKSFREDVANGLRQTFLQALRTNQTRSKKSIPQVVTVELSSLSRVDSDNVLIQFAVQIDAQPMKAVDAAAIFNRLPDLIATLNENLPYQVVKAPSAVVAISLPPVADFTGWLAAVVVLAVLCALLVPLLIFYIKKSWRGGGGVPASQRESRSFKKERTGTSSVCSEVKRHLKDVEKGESENKPLPRPLPAPPRITDVLSLLQPTAAPSHSCRPPLTQDSTEKMVNLQTAVSTKMNNRKGSVAMKSLGTLQNDALTARQMECNCGDTFEQSAQMNETEEFPKAINIPSRFQSSVVPLPLLKSKRLTVQDSDSEEEVEVSLKKSICAPGKTLSQSRAQVSELKPFADMTDREMQRKADAERQRNKRRLREKQRQSQKTDLGETGMSQRPKAETQETNNKSTKKDEASKRKKNKDKELAAWKRAQAQIESLLDSQPGIVNTRLRNMKAPQAFPWRSTRVQDLSHQVPQMEFNSYGATPMTAYPTRNGEWPWMNTPQTAFRGPLPYPWQTGPLPNTRHNAEFLRCVQNPFQSLYNPVPYSQDQSLIFSQYSDLPGSMQVDGDEASGNESKSTESNSPQSNQGTQTQTLSMNTETTYPPGLPVLSPGSGHYLQLLMSLASQPTDVAATQVGSRGEVKSQASPAGQFSEGHEQARERRKKHKSVASTDEAQVSEEQTHLHSIGQQ